MYEVQLALLLVQICLCVCFSQKVTAYTVCFESTNSVNDPLTFFSVCVFQEVVYGRCLESETGLRG